MDCDNYCHNPSSYISNVPLKSERRNWVYLTQIIYIYIYIYIVVCMLLVMLLAHCTKVILSV